MTERELYDAELCLTGAMLIAPSRCTTWRPTDPHLRCVVRELAAAAGNPPRVIDLGLVFDRLVSVAPSFDWVGLMLAAMQRADAVFDRVAYMKPIVLEAMKYDARCAAAYDALDRSVDALVAARCAAEKALETFNAECTGFETFAHGAVLSDPSTLETAA